MKKLIFLTTLFVLIGCQGSPMHISSLSSKQLDSISSWDLCNAYHLNHEDKVREELLRQGEIPINEWKFIDQKKIHIGMSKLCCVCAWGDPRVFGRINKSVGSWGVHEQWVYKQVIGQYSATYVYFENGKISSWQD